MDYIKKKKTKKKKKNAEKDRGDSSTHSVQQQRTPSQPNSYVNSNISKHTNENSLTSPVQKRHTPSLSNTSSNSGNSEHSNENYGSDNSDVCSEPPPLESPISINLTNLPQDLKIKQEDVETMTAEENINEQEEPRKHIMTAEENRNK